MTKQPIQGVTDDADNPNYIIFTNFYIYRSEWGWRWVNSAATRSSPAAFDSAPMCALNAERTLRDAALREKP